MLLMFLSSVFCAFVLTWLTLKSVKTRSSFNNLPPGPPGVPILGNVLSVLYKPYLQFSKWASRYGNWYTISICGRPALVVNDAKLMRQVFGTPESMGLFKVPLFAETFEGTNGVGLSEGSVWQEQRTFFLKAMKICGLGQSSVIEPILQSEADKLVCWLEEQSALGPVIKIRYRLIESMGAIFWKLITGSSDAREEIGVLMSDWYKALHRLTKSGIMFLPFIKHIAPEWSGHNFSKQTNAKLDFKLKKTFEHFENNDSSGTANLFAEYLHQWKNCENLESSFYGEKGWLHAFHSIKATLLAGGESSGTILNWMLNYLTAYPDLQQKLYNEIRNVLGCDEIPKLTDKFRMPFMEATVLETLRMSSFSAFGIIHRLLDDVHMEGYTLPKDMFLISNHYYVHNDRSVWGDPENFRPDRFLERNEEQRKTLREHVVAFQTGKRLCPGEGLAKDELFILGARLVQKLEMLPLPGKAQNDYVDPQVGFNLLPPQTGIIFRARI